MTRLALDDDDDVPIACPATAIHLPRSLDRVPCKQGLTTNLLTHQSLHCTLGEGDHYYYVICLQPIISGSAAPGRFSSFEHKSKHGFFSPGW